MKTVNELTLFAYDNLICYKFSDDGVSRLHLRGDCKKKVKV